MSGSSIVDVETSAAKEEAVGSSFTGEIVGVTKAELGKNKEARTVSPARLSWGARRRWPGKAW
jgi:hypothetical protein